MRNLFRISGVAALPLLTLAACVIDAPTFVNFDGGAIDADPNAPDAIPIEATVPEPRLPINDSYVGSMFVTGSRRPTFAWNGPSDGAITYELEFSTDGTFATGVTMVSSTETSHQPATDLPVSVSAPVGSRYFWRVRACASDICSAYSPKRWVNLGRSDQDFNGDGYSDVVVGEPTVNGTGHVYVYFGTFDAIADGTLVGVGSDQEFGHSVASAGDVNGDGYADLVVGSPGSDPAAGADAGRAYVFYGGTGQTFDATPDGTMTGGSAGHRFGTSVASTGDVNGDGFADVVVGAPSEDGASGRAYVYLGGAGATFHPAPNPDGMLYGASLGDELGASVASAGDVNGDGFADVIVGARLNDAAGPGVGRAHVYFGAAGTNVDGSHDGVLTGAATDERFGTAVASAGDVNNDGFADLVVGATSPDTGEVYAGRAYLYLGAAGTTLEPTADTTLVGQSIGECFGVSVSSAGDVNGDGFSDIVVGATRASTGGQVRGAAYVYLGGSGTVLDATIDGTLTGASPGDEFGTSVASAGDINRDGFADVLVGAPNHDPKGQGAGSAYVYLGGGGAAFDTTVDGTLIGTAYYGRFGISVQ